MKKNVGFVIVFFAIIYGLISLHYCSLHEAQKDVNIVNLADIAQIKYPLDLREGSDIPFSLLLDVEYKKLLPDSINYEIFRPELIFLSKDFNEKDPSQLISFDNITINSLESNTLYDEAKINEIKTGLETNLSRTPYRIKMWKPTKQLSINGASGVQLAFVQENQNSGKMTHIVMTYLVKNNKEVNLVLSASDHNLKQWETYYSEIINSIQID